MTNPVFYHHSPDLFENFDWGRTSSYNGSGLWANTTYSQWMHNQTRVEYSFTTIKEPAFLNLARALPEEDYHKLLSAAVKAGDTELASAMRRSEPSQFVPHDFQKNFETARAGLIVDAGFDGIATGDTVCFLSDKNISDFHLVQTSGRFKERIDGYVGSLEQKYPVPAEALEQELRNGALPPNAAQSVSQVAALLDEASRGKTPDITEAQAQHLKDTYTRLYLDQISGDADPEFNATRLFLYEFDKVAPHAHSDEARLRTDPFMPGFLKPLSPEKGSIGEIKDRMRAALSQGIQESTEIAHQRGIRQADSPQTVPESSPPEGKEVASEALSADLDQDREVFPESEVAQAGEPDFLPVDNAPSSGGLDEVSDKIDAPENAFDSMDGEDADIIADDIPADIPAEAHHETAPSSGDLDQVFDDVSAPEHAFDSMGGGDPEVIADDIPADIPEEVRHGTAPSPGDLAPEVTSTRMSAWGQSGGSAAGIGISVVGLTNAVQAGDTGGIMVSGADLAVSSGDLALDVTQAAGGSVSNALKGLATKANIALMVADGAYQISQEEGLDNKTARAGAVFATTGSAMAVGGTAATVGATGIAATAATVAAPVAAAVAVGMTADAAVDAYKATEHLKGSIARQAEPVKSDEFTEPSGAPSLLNYKNLRWYAKVEADSPDESEGLNQHEIARQVMIHEYSRDPEALDKLEEGLKEKIAAYDQTIEAHDSWVHDSVRFFWANDDIEAQRDAEMAKAPYVAAAEELRMYRAELADYQLIQQEPEHAPPDALAAKTDLQDDSPALSPVSSEHEEDLAATSPVSPKHVETLAATPDAAGPDEKVDSAEKPSATTSLSATFKQEAEGSPSPEIKDFAAEKEHAIQESSSVENTRMALEGQQNSVESYCPEIEELQQALIALDTKYENMLTYTNNDFEKVAVDGLEGWRTREAVTLFTQEHNLGDPREIPINTLIAKAQELAGPEQTATAGHYDEQQEPFEAMDEDIASFNGAGTSYAGDLSLLADARDAGISINPAFLKETVDRDYTRMANPAAPQI
ncbi:MAG: hypothetical protein EOM12_12830 [Verrucomicrobiae bacterium]|nr:hypothetical protein [Verrucomicrobiae bacterium]